MLVDVRLRRPVDEQRESRRREDVGLELDPGLGHACIVPRRCPPPDPLTGGVREASVEPESASAARVIPEFREQIKNRLDMSRDSTYSCLLRSQTHPAFILRSATRAGVHDLEHPHTSEGYHSPLPTVNRPDGVRRRLFPWLLRAPRPRNQPPRTDAAHRRLSFAKITDTLTVPDLLALQTESFDWLVGNDAWKARVAEAKAAGRNDLPETTGLEEIFEEISPDRGPRRDHAALVHRPRARRAEVHDRRVQGAAARPSPLRST